MFDSLPYVDHEISAAQRELASTMIQGEVAVLHKSALHPRLSDLPDSRLSPMLRQEVLRAGAGRALEGGVDLTHYEALDDASPDSNVEITKAALQSAYTNLMYLRNRQTNISLLEEHGKNAWLVGNSHTEEIHKQLQMELDRTRADSETLNRMRKTAQEESRAELLGLEDTWKQGIGRIVETQLATDQLHQQMANSHP